MPVVPVARGQVDLARGRARLVDRRDQQVRAEQVLVVEVARRGDRVTLRAEVDGEALEVRDGRVTIANAGTGFGAELGV